VHNSNQGTLLAAGFITHAPMDCRHTEGVDTVCTVYVVNFACLVFFVEIIDSFNWLSCHACVVLTLVFA